MAPKKKFNQKPFGEANFNQIYRRYKRDATRRKHKFKLTKKEFKKIIVKKCHYCNKLPLQINKTKSCNGYFLHNGIDRLDNLKGYVLENIVACCKECNFAKHKKNEEEFLDLVKRIYEFRIQKPPKTT